MVGGSLKKNYDGKRKGKKKAQSSFGECINLIGPTLLCLSRALF
jgi:hypothetical protein